MQKFIYILLSLPLLFVSCDKSDNGTPATSSVEVSIRASHGTATRTAMGEVSGNKHSIEWSVGDKVSVWARPTSAAVDAPYTLDATTFTLATYNPAYNDADFKATISAMAEDTYNYHALYPAPAASNINGTSVTYSLPALQTGAYNPALDVMYASATGNALIDRGSSITNIPIEWQEPTLAFSHLFHLLRIRIPEGKNGLDFPIKRLDITFSQGVVGDVIVDATTGSLQWVEEALAKSISIVLDDSNMVDANDGYVWVHVLPRQLSGDVTFVAYNEAGVNSNPITTQIDKVLSPQTITPISLTIPTSPLAPLTYVEIIETANNLGEQWNTMNLSGRNYVTPFTGTTSQTLTITPNAAERYLVAISAAPSTLANQSLAMTYDTPNTYFDAPIPLGSSLTEGVYNSVNHQVPYLLEEDFSSITSEQESSGNNDDRYSDRNQSGEELGQLPGWNAARFWAKNGAVRINVRYQKVKVLLTFASTHYGRLDTAPLSKLKAGKSVTVKVVFDSEACYGKEPEHTIATSSLSITAHTNLSNPIDGIPTGSTGITSSYDTTVADFGPKMATFSIVLNGEATDRFNQQLTTYSTDSGTKKQNISGVTNSTRLCFFPEVAFSSTSDIGNAESHVYLDNIRVSIAN